MKSGVRWAVRQPGPDGPAARDLLPQRLARLDPRTHRRAVMVSSFLDLICRCH
jgi:hypothetical protein